MHGHVHVCVANLRRDVHELVTHGEEMLGIEGLGEEVRQVVACGDIRHDDVEVLDALADEEVTTLDMLHARVVLRVVRGGNGSLVVRSERGGRAVADAEIRKEHA